MRAENIAKPIPPYIPGFRPALKPKTAPVEKPLSVPFHKSVFPIGISKVFNGTKTKNNQDRSRLICEFQWLAF